VKLLKASRLWVPHSRRGSIAAGVGAFSIEQSPSRPRVPRTALHKAAGFALYSVLGLAPYALSQTAPELAARVDHHYNSIHSLRVNFVQQYDGLGQDRRESGVLLLKKPGRMRWTYSQPPGKLFVLDGHDAYFYAPGQTEVQRVPAKKLDDLRSPLRFLLGHAELAKELNELQITPKGDNFELSGVPQGMQQRIASLHFTVSPEGKILGIQAEEVDGSISQFTFNGEEDNAPAADSDFIFHPPPGTAIVNGLPPE
jgi:outer membrane lipoprotein carrier protein